MPRVFQYTKTFRKLFDRLPETRKRLMLKCMEALKPVSEGKAPSHGLMIKRLHVQNEEILYEARAGIDLRILWIQSKIYFRIVFIGDHDEVQKYIKNSRLP